MMMENRKYKLNNKGASLVELIITIAIMIIVIGGLTIGFSVITNTYAKRAANNINDYLQTTRTKAMTIVADEWNIEISKKSDDYIVAINKVTITQDADGNDVRNSEVFDQIFVGGDVDIEFKDSSLASKLTIDENNKLTIVYSLSQGSISDILYNDTSIAGGSLGDMGVFSIRSGSFGRDINLYYTTGKSEIIE